jgi:hypothetical protein
MTDELFLRADDDFKNELLSENTAPHLRRFFEEQWPDPSPFERTTEAVAEEGEA